MTADIDTVRQMLKHTSDEHRSLLGAARGIETMLEGSVAPATGDLARRLEALVEELQSHFKEEEASALYRSFPSAFPGEQATLDRLEAQHKPILETLTTLAKTVAASPSVELESELSANIRGVVAELRQHEAGESALLHRLVKASQT